LARQRRRLAKQLVRRTRGKIDQARWIAAIERQIGDLVALHHLADLGGRGIELLGVSNHGHGLGNCARLHGQIQRGRLANRKYNAGSHQRGKALRIGGHRIRSRWQQREFIGAAGV
jgi:hypothetical protein